MWISNRVLLGLVFLIPGLLKLFVMGPEEVTGMLNSLGFPAAIFFAWILIIVEIVAGAMIVFNWQMKYAVWGPFVIILVAGFLVYFSIEQLPSFLMHLLIASNLLIWGHDGKKK